MAVHEVGGAVERIAKPAERLLLAAALFGDEPQPRRRGRQAGDDQRLALQIELGDEVAARLLGRGRMLAVTAEQQLACLGRYLEREARVAFWSQLAPWHFLYFLPLP